MRARRRRRTRSIATLIIGLLLATGAHAAEPRLPVARGPLSADEQLLVDLFERTAPSVVYVTMRSRHPGAEDGSHKVFTVASGVVWDETGLVVTNHHVITQRGVPWVTFISGGEASATVVAEAPELDIAVLQVAVPPEGLTPIVLGTSADLRVGQTVIAIGNPFGLDHTLTLGIVSALDREMKRHRGRLFGLVQTDAAINPGNSGGPLLDSAGRLIGINTAIATDTGTSIGVGFAVPVDDILRLVTRLGTQHVARAADAKPIQLSGLTLGLVLAKASMSARFKVPGLLVRSVEPGSAAERAGIIGLGYASGAPVVGDVLVSVDGKPVTSHEELVRMLDAHPVGAEVVLELERDGARRTSRLRIGE